ncbi:MobF family relaxase [Geodermatophilus chilensis]|uniref:MobF family relaxase n=1 Tax=Geodermatophilus chilensis TaxID=2035835 RepID=UPI000C267611|nr:MobF family relaxase [Geodermatophilus chilensis]
MHGGFKFFTGAPAAARHYVEASRHRADDYYLAEGTGIVRRYTAAAGGPVAELAPLTGDAYEAWVAGLDPDTAEPRGRLRTDDRAVRFVEVIVNGPKSWSLAAALHPDIARAYDAAQDRAAEQIIGWLAGHATTRVGPRGGQVQVPVERLEAATVRHHTSRAGDPHRHLHLQIHTRVLAADSWRGLHTVGVRDFIGAINGIGHAAVACDPTFRAVLAAHSYTLDRTGEVQELADYVGPFSARAVQIGRNRDRYEQEWTAANPGQTPGPALRRAWDARAWADGRPDKVTPQPGEDLTARWVAELAALGYRDRDKPVDLVAAPVGALDRDAAVDTVLSRLAAGRSAWNAADVRGEVEQLIAAAGIVADPGVRIELAEDLTARAMAACVPLLEREGLPEHIRAWTSRPVLDVEADLTARLAARSAPVAFAAEAGVTPLVLARLDAGQAAAATALAGLRGLVLVEGAAGAGKTTLLAAARELLEAQGRRLVVVTPTQKAAKVAAAEVGTRTGSAAWLAYQHGWRWDDHGTWTRLAPEDGDPLIGAGYAGPEEGARLRPGDLMVVDEAGMLDQDTARALLTVADESLARVALIGDRRQLAAVGRGGVLDLAVRQVDPAAHMSLDEVHRFTRTDATGATVPDDGYVELTLAMRGGEEPGSVFNALAARGQVRLHADPTALQEALAATAAAHHRDREQVALVVDTQEQADQLNAAVRDRLVADGRVDDTRAVTTRVGQRIGIGDRIATRRNDRSLRVANRDIWTVTAAHDDGRLTVTPSSGNVTPAGVTPSAYKERVLSPTYVTSHVELAYATTAHGVQGDTVPAAHVMIGEHTSAASAYVGMTRGRTANTAHLVAADLAEAREQWIAVFGRDRADLGPSHATELAAAEVARYAPPREFAEVLSELQQLWTAEQHCLTRLAIHTSLRDKLAELAALHPDTADRVAALSDTCWHTGAAARQATTRAEASGSLVAAEADRIRQGLLDAWDGDREAARTAATLVLRGSGPLGLRRAAVARAGEQLTDWAHRWRTHLPDLPTDTRQIAQLAGRSDDRPALRAALDAHARRAAQDRHPEHAAACAAADAAELAHRQAQRALAEARNRQDDLLRRFGRLAHIPDPAGGLTRLDRDIAATRVDLAAAEASIVRAQADPAILTLPPGRLSAHRDAWLSRRNTDAVERPATVRRPTEGLERSLGYLRPSANRSAAGPSLGR